MFFDNNQTKLWFSQNKSLGVWGKKNLYSSKWVFTNTPIFDGKTIYVPNDAKKLIRMGLIDGKKIEILSKESWDSCNKISDEITSSNYRIVYN